MSKEDFLQKLLQQIPLWEELELSNKEIAFYPEGFVGTDEEERELIRGANMRYHDEQSDRLISGMLIIRPERKSDLKTICRFDLDDLYGQFCEGGWERIHEICKDNIDTSRSIEQYSILNKMSEYEQIKNSLIIRPLNFPDNQYELKSCIYKQVGDIALVLYGILRDDKYNLGTFKICRNYLRTWDKTLDDVFEAALSNTYMRMPPRLYMTPDQIVNAPYERGAFMGIGYHQSLGAMDCPTITTTRKINGAVAMFYPGVRERLSTIAGGDFFVAFTSIHEARIHPKGIFTPQSIFHGLESVNNSFDKKEILSRKVYQYNAGNGTFTVCAG